MYDSVTTTEARSPAPQGVYDSVTTTETRSPAPQGVYNITKTETKGLTYSDTLTVCHSYTLSFTNCKCEYRPLSTVQPIILRIVHVIVHA